MIGAFRVNFFAAIKHRVAIGALRRTLGFGVCQRCPRGIQTAVSAFKKSAHVGREKRFVAGVQLVSGIQINDAPVLRERTDVRTRRSINKCNQSHKIADYEEMSSTPQTSLLARRDFRKRRDYGEEEGCGLVPTPFG